MWDKDDHFGRWVQFICTCLQVLKSFPYHLLIIPILIPIDLAAPAMVVSFSATAVFGMPSAVDTTSTTTTSERLPMFSISALALLLLVSPQDGTRPHLPAAQVNDIATILAHDEGWPLGNPDYTLDPMKPDVDDGFDSIGVYKKAHLVRMYSIDRTTGQIVDFMRGCQVFRFKDLENFEQSIRAKSHASPLTDVQLAAKVGCAKLTLVNTRWIR